MATKHYAIFDPTTGLYSVGHAHSIQSWTTLDEAHVWNRLSYAKAHVTNCNKMAKNQLHKCPSPYSTPMEIVEVERVCTNKGLAEKI